MRFVPGKRQLGYMLLGACLVFFILACESRVKYLIKSVVQETVADQTK